MKTKGKIMNPTIKKHIIIEYWIALILLILSTICSIAYELLPILKLTQNSILVHGNLVIMFLVFLWTKKLRRIVKEGK